MATKRGTYDASAAPKRVRTCVACGAKQGKASLLRIVRSACGVAFDPTGRAAGRGAYVCSPDCLEAALRTGRLSRALKAPVSEQDAATVAGDLSAHVALLQG